MNASKLAEQFLALPVEASIDEVRAVLVGVEVEWPSIANLHQLARAYLASEKLATEVREVLIGFPEFTDLADILAEYEKASK